MKFGVILPSFGEQASRLTLVDTALAAESHGFESVWVTDHLALPEVDADRFGHIFEALTTLGYVAGCTSRVRLGVSALVLPQRNPVEVAKEVATLDALSGGRMIMAVAAGWSEGEFANLGYSFHNRGKRLDEAIKVLRTIWRGSRAVSFSGKFYQFEKMVISPGSLQPGGPPLWVGGDQALSLNRALAFGDGWHPNSRPPEVLRNELDAVWSQLQRRPFAIALRMRLRFSEEPQDAVPLSGTPQQIIDRLSAYQQAGMNYALVHFEAESQADRERAILRFSREVMPAFRS